VRVQCIANTAAVLSERHFRNGYTTESTFHISTGREYTLFAVSLYRGVVHFLLSDDTNRPNWYPFEMFVIIDCSIPHGWLLSSTPANAEGLQLLMGYPSLIEIDSHYDDLLERVPCALEIFANERAAAESSELT
jgi:hypothetical protein